jgi:hypothetical protein
MDPSLLQGNFVPVFNIDNLKLETGTVTLKIRSRSNGWHVTKDIVRVHHLT